MMPSTTPTSGRLRGRFASVPPRAGRGPARWTRRLLVVSVVCGLVGGVTNVARLSMAFLIASTTCAAAALIVYLIETRPPRLR